VKFFRKSLLVTLVVAVMVTFTPQKVDAFLDPVTIAILAPIAIKAAQIMAPYVRRGLAVGGKAMISMLGDMLKLFYLPLGVIECTLGLPFGFFGSGVDHLCRGAIAPFVVCLDCLMLPIKFMGISGG